MKFAGSKRKTYIKRTQTLTSILMCVTCDLALRPTKVMESVYDGVPKGIRTPVVAVKGDISV